jgi:hypothetical protein
MRPRGRSHPRGPRVLSDQRASATAGTALTSLLRAALDRRVEAGASRSPGGTSFDPPMAVSTGCQLRRLLLGYSPRLLLARTTPRHNLDTAVACNPAGQSAPRGIRTPTARCVAWCSASTSSAPDGHGLLRLGASSVQTDRVGSRRIVRMTIGMTKPGRDDPSASQDRRSSGIELQIWASCAQGKNGPRRASRLHCLAVTDRPGCALGVG